MTNLHILHRIFLLTPPGVGGSESEGVRGYFANISVSGGDPSPSVIRIIVRRAREEVIWTKELSHELRITLLYNDRVN